MMMLHFVFAIIMLGATRAGAPSKSISASIKDTSVDGFEGLNINLAVPFNINDYIIGFQHKLGSDITKGPDSLFIKRSVKITDGSVAAFESSFSPARNILSVGAKWMSKNFGSFSFSFDNKKYLKAVGFEKSAALNNLKVKIGTDYDIKGENADLQMSVSDGTSDVKLAYNTATETTKVSLAQKIDDSNAVTGGINLKTGVQDYKWLQKRPGTTIETTLCVNPTSSLKELFDLSGKKVSINWKDAGSAGTWSATAQFPLDDFKATKVSIAHMWDI